MVYIKLAMVKVILCTFTQSDQGIGSPHIEYLGTVVYTIFILSIYPKYWDSHALANSVNLDEMLQDLYASHSFHYENMPIQIY